MDQSTQRGTAVITGIGLVSPIGSTREEVLDHLRSGTTGIAPITKFDTSHFRSKYGGEVKDLAQLGEIDSELARRWDDPYLHYAIVAAKRALADAESGSESTIPRQDTGLVVGTCNGGLLSAEKCYREIPSLDLKKVHFLSQPSSIGVALSSVLGIVSDTWVVTTACSASVCAIGLACTLIRKRYLKRVVVGASDALCISNMAGFNGLKALSQQHCAPFSQPYGLTIGEGACVWVIEDAQAARMRRAKIYGAIAGFASSSDAYHATTPDPKGESIAYTLTSALAESGLTMLQLGCINSHGTGTEANDRAESRGIQSFCKEISIPVISLKPFFGHCMGSAGLIEATCNLYAMQEGFLPPTLNFTEPRPGCNLDYVVNTPRQKKYRSFIKANYAFGGNNAAVVITADETDMVPGGVRDSRVVVTGAGLVSVLGVNLQKTMDGLYGGFGPVQEGSSQKTATVMPLIAQIALDECIQYYRRIPLSSVNRISAYAAAAVFEAMNDASIQVGRKNAMKIGIAMGISHGSDESDHLLSVIRSGTHQAHISSFSTITANATAGQVSVLLGCKGASMTFATGAHAGLQGLAWAFEEVWEGRADGMIAAASDQLYPHLVKTLAELGMLYDDTGEWRRGIDCSMEEKRVPAEGAAALYVESFSSACSRHVPILAEICGYAFGIHPKDALQSRPSGIFNESLQRVVRTACLRSGVDMVSVDAILWAPLGTRADLVVVQTIDSLLERQLPFITTTLNTGFVDSASILMTCAAAIKTFSAGRPIWPSVTGIEELDGRFLSKPPRYLLAISSSESGYLAAMVFKNGQLN